MENYIKKSKKELMKMGLDALCKRKKELDACELNLIQFHLGEDVTIIHTKIKEEMDYVQQLLKKKSKEWDNAWKKFRKFN